VTTVKSEREHGVVLPDSNGSEQAASEEASKTPDHILSSGVSIGKLFRKWEKDLCNESGCKKMQKIAFSK